MAGPPLPLAMATTNRPQSRPASPRRDGGPSRLEVNESARNGVSRVRDAVALTFDDVLLVPRHSLTHPRDVNVASRFSRGIELRVPLVAAAMDAVTESGMAIAMARAGGLDVLPSHISITRLAALEHRRYRCIN